MKEFSSLSNIMTLLFAAGVIFNLIITHKRKTHWGRGIVTTSLIGLLVCIFAATRDLYGFEDAIISFTGIEASILSILGVSILALSISAIFIKSTNYRKNVFYLINFIFIIKLVMMEVIRLISLF